MRAVTHDRSWFTSLPDNLVTFSYRIHNDRR